MTSGTAASLLGAMMCAPATCGMSASSRTRSRQMRRPSAAGSPAPSSRAISASGMIAPIQLFLDPARRLHRAQRHHADDQRSLAGDAVLGEPRHVAAHHAGIHAELGLHELRAGGELAGERLSAPSRAADRSGCRRRRGRSPRGRRSCGRSAVRRYRAGGARSPTSWRGSRSNTGLASGWSPADGSSPRSISRLRTPLAAARSDRFAARCGCGRGR